MGGQFFERHLKYNAPNTGFRIKNLENILRYGEEHGKTIRDIVPSKRHKIEV